MPRKRVDVSNYDRDRDGRPEHVRDYSQEREVRGEGETPAMLAMRRNRGPELANDSIFDLIRNGSRVTILIPAGKHYDYHTGAIEQEWKEKEGRAVMRGPAGWVLNMGGPYGTPGIATPDNVVRVR